MAGTDTLAIMPTGAGKSLCYQLPSLVREGLTVVVSPLIALMRDQVTALRHFGIEAGSLNSANDQDENRRVVDAVRDGRMRVLYASPERLANTGTTEWLGRSGVNLLAIDEEARQVERRQVDAWARTAGALERVDDAGTGVEHHDAGTSDPPGHVHRDGSGGGGGTGRARRRPTRWGRYRRCC